MKVVDNPYICHLILFPLLFILGPSILKAQRLALPGEDEASLAKELCYCKPGVANKSRSKGLELYYGNYSGFNWTPDGQSSDPNGESIVSGIGRFTAKLKIPILNKENLKVLLGYEYGTEVFRFDQVGTQFSPIFSSLNNETLKTNKFTFILTKPFNDKYYGMVRFRSTFNGDYDGLVSFDDRYGIYSAIVALGIKPRDDLEWGVGLSYSNSFIRTRVLPFLIYNRTFNEKWGLEAVLPLQVFGRYNFNPSSIMLFGVEFKTKSYSLDFDDPGRELVSEFTFRHSELAAKVSWERKIVPWVWVNVEGGYQMPFNSNFEDTRSGDYSFDASPEGNLFLRVGLFLSPPDKFFK